MVYGCAIPGVVDGWGLGRVDVVFAARWRELASETGALKGLRRNRSVENPLRALPLHVGCGHLLRETAGRLAKLADCSTMALMKRLKKSGNWLYVLCAEDHAVGR